MARRVFVTYGVMARAAKWADDVMTNGEVEEAYRLEEEFGPVQVGFDKKSLKVMKRAAYYKVGRDPTIRQYMWRLILIYADKHKTVYFSTDRNRATRVVHKPKKAPVDKHYVRLENLLNERRGSSSRGTGKGGTKRAHEVRGFWRTSSTGKVHFVRAHQRGKGTAPVTVLV